MEACCDHKTTELLQLKGEQRRVLIIALVLNLLMFFLELFYGYHIHSSTLMADSLDMLGDSLVYGMTLFVLYKNPNWGRRVSIIKGFLMGLFGIGVLYRTIEIFWSGQVPDHEVLGALSFLALLVNITCALLLLRFRNADLNMRSTWLCTRNDVLTNLGMMLAALLVYLTASNLPDLIMGFLLSALVLRSSFVVIRESVQNA